MSKALERDAALFAALGDPLRLAIIKRLGDGVARSATQLAEDAPVTRQAITKHLAVLEEAKLVVSVKQGREVLYALETARVDDAREFLEAISQRWDRAIERLRKHVEG